MSGAKQGTCLVDVFPQGGVGFEIAGEGGDAGVGEGGEGGGGVRDYRG